MTDEERQRAMDFIVTQQAKNSVEIEERYAEKLESQAHTDRRLDALIDIVRHQRNGPSS